jgi:hypothetical protein
MLHCVASIQVLYPHSLRNQIEGKKENIMTTPNIYQLHGHNLSVTYSTGELGSLKSFEYQDAFQTLVFKGAEIRIVVSEIGTLVTVTIRSTVDSGSTSFTLLVPTVNLPGPNSHAHITTEGITTLHRFSINPKLNQGQTELYIVTQLTGTAEAIPF